MRVIKKIWWIPLAIYMIVIPSFVSDWGEATNCKDIEVNIHDSIDYRFVDRDMIFSLVHNESERTLGRPIKDIDIRGIEERLNEIKELKYVEVYKTVDGIVHIDVDQRDPVVRIISSYGNSYYIDSEGVIIQHSSKYTPRVTVVSGEISLPDSCIARGDINTLPPTNKLIRVLRVAELINKNDLWAGQFEQIWISKSGNIELVPRVGNHIIKLGKPDNIEKKLQSLESLYKNGIGELGWNRYREINLMYEGQIVCKKR